ncbi:hypothetical protein QP157_12285 [Sphingomonas sp. LR61]|uniref:hypothetical protein n=1 Tax=Sphingomonas sp. LR61 TaxID=3050234 RepID=UPI002FE07088
MTDDGEIRSATQLPARRTDVELVTDDHLTLVGELAEPESRSARGTVVTLHPLPTAHGFMDSHVLKKAAARLPALADIAVLRFNFRSVTSPRGTSEGVFGEGVSEGLRPARRRRRGGRPWSADAVVGRVVLRHRGDPQVRTGTRRGRHRGGRGPALSAVAPHHGGRARALGSRGRPGGGPGARARRLPAARRSDRPVRRRPERPGRP